MCEGLLSIELPGGFDGRERETEEEGIGSGLGTGNAGSSYVARHSFFLHSVSIEELTAFWCDRQSESTLATGLAEGN
jgi:hypothetical protein